MSTGTLIAVVALVLSFTTFLINLWAAHRAAVRARKPILAFVWGERGWAIHNIGNGPALNVLVALREKPYWFDPVRVPPLAKDTSFDCHWLGKANLIGLGVEYTDSEGGWYTATTGDDNTVVSEGRWLPNWGHCEIKPYWKAPAYGAHEPRWCERRSSFPAGYPPHERVPLSRFFGDRT
jgi:hypothetical protein